MGILQTEMWNIIEGELDGKRVRKIGLELVKI
jgi:hypothetical protein